MLKALKRISICLLCVCVVWLGMLLGDRQKLRQELIRLHVVAASDSEEDQNLKLQVRDAVIRDLRDAMEDVADASQARAYLQEQLPKLQTLAEETLRAAGCYEKVTVSLGTEEFTTRIYDTFTLPAGVYESLRIIIGQGEGHNWWCVVFPTLCLPATSEGFEDVAAGAGFSEELTGTLEGEEKYEVRFYLLDALGRLENFLHAG